MSTASIGHLDTVELHSRHGDLPYLYDLQTYGSQGRQCEDLLSHYRFWADGDISVKLPKGSILFLNKFRVGKCTDFALIEVHGEYHRPAAANCILYV